MPAPETRSNCRAGWRRYPSGISAFPQNLCDFRQVGDRVEVAGRLFAAVAAVRNRCQCRSDARCRPVGRRDRCGRPCARASRRSRPACSCRAPSPAPSSRRRARADHSSALDQRLDLLVSELPRVALTHPAIVMTGPYRPVECSSASQKLSSHRCVASKMIPSRSISASSSRPRGPSPPLACVPCT